MSDFDIENLVVSSEVQIVYTPLDSTFRKALNVRSVSQSILNKIYGKRKNLSIFEFYSRWTLINPQKSYQDFITFLEELCKKKKIYISLDTYYTEEQYIISDSGKKMLKQTNNPILRKYLNVISVINEAGDEANRNDFIYDIGNDVAVLFIDDMITKLNKHGLIQTEEQRIETEKRVNKQKREIEKQKYKINSFIQGSKGTLTVDQVSRNSLLQVCKSRKIPGIQQNMTKQGLIDIITKFKTSPRHKAIDTQQKQDIFGNEIINPVMGDDGIIYDRSSLQKWFQKNESGDYVNIKYKYDQFNRPVPIFVSLGGVRPLTSYHPV